ncbi:uroporphyrinogen decarboxylase [Tissierella praeacuta DSM 18095]|uniref:Uroporphyrinogen decarboxylase n=1 Tax=Tissierella praeacuta DSM 18095 TaxID=1123404 RepID=A0A1M4V705_9FIRM|nr:uroporphyrinogen decarboxylase family protein [Tissierella praeacuta]TCU74108.1 uroporphyrinogen decarboxylase [Tissierella praeacuta]SHE64702.1 uroporphyrinogen decarboxylase [Tissierella praeacuta DSM 18095]SUP02963.1 methylcobalamin:coenzyme M methyltransferase [Tissierella praeacuta]
MNREQRIMAALRNQEVDRVPVSAWMHFSEVDQDPISLAQTQVAFNEEYDFDFIKLMPFGTYSIQDWGAQLKIYCHKYHEPIIIAPGIKEVSDYSKLEVLPAYYGTWGKQLQLSQQISKIIPKHTPYVQTIFSPISTLKKLAGDRLFKDIKENPAEVHKALEVITATTINFVKENINAGVSGFFLATQNANYDLMNDEEFKEFGMKYDLELIKSYADQTYFNIIHIHGDNIMFDTIAENYPVNCINWHDRHTFPSLSEARKKTDKCFLGGIQEVPYFVDGVLNYDSIMARSTKEQILEHAKEAIEEIDGKGFILGPGCVVDPKTAKENLKALRESVEVLRKSVNLD